MQEVYSSTQARVFDEVLDPDSLNQLWRFVQEDNFSRINGRYWNKGWRLEDGMPLSGSTFSSEKDLPGPLTPLLRAIRDVAAGAADLIGVEDQAWTKISTSVMLYPAGTGLSWHSDGARAGAWAYYIHPIWNVQWGGDLLIAHESVINQKAQQRPSPALDNRLENELLLRMPMGVFIPPRPNRLVIIGFGQVHRIAMVNDLAGANVRCALSGFFTR